jgi:hypothetical protein
MDFRWLTKGEQPDHSTISIFRKQLAKTENRLAAVRRSQTEIQGARGTRTIAVLSATRSRYAPRPVTPTFGLHQISSRSVSECSTLP